MHASALLLALLFSAGIEFGPSPDGPASHASIPQPAQKAATKVVSPARAQATDSALASVMERLALPPMEGLELSMDALHATLTLRGSDVNALYTAVKGQTTLCPRVEKLADGIKLGCETQQLDAKLSRDARGATVLDVRKLRGIPLADPQAFPLFPFEPSDFGWGSACPGSTPMGRGECLLRVEGQRAKAKSLLTAALKTLERSAAALRLGELAMRDGNSAEALQFFEQAGKGGAVGKLARMHVCELTGNCVGRELVDPLADTRDIPEPMRTELELRLMRLKLYTGTQGPVFAALLERLSQATRPSACRVALRFCELLVKEALVTSGSTQGMDRASALTLFLKLQSQSEVPLPVPVIAAAAETASTLGAPLFGANLLAAAFLRVEPASLAHHLLRTAELYLESGDHARADVILTFARQKLGGTALAQRPWVTVQRALMSKPAPTVKASRVSILTSTPRARIALAASDSTEELARATTALSHARRQLQEEGR